MSSEPPDVVSALFGRGADHTATEIGQQPALWQAVTIDANWLSVPMRLLRS